MLDSIIETIKQDPEAFIILVLFIVSEILGSMERFKSSSLFQLLKTVLGGMLAKTKFGVPSVPVLTTQEEEPKKEEKPIEVK